jgi:hypothetical protein
MKNKLYTNKHLGDLFPVEVAQIEKQEKKIAEQELKLKKQRIKFNEKIAKVLLQALFNNKSRLHSFLSQPYKKEYKVPVINYLLYYGVSLDLTEEDIIDKGLSSIADIDFLVVGANVYWQKIAYLHCRNDYSNNNGIKIWVDSTPQKQAGIMDQLMQSAEDRGFKPSYLAYNEKEYLKVLKS